MDITAQNAIYLDEETGGKGRQFKSRFLVPGLVKYDYGVCLLTKENADKFIQGFVGCPVVINHQTVTDDNAKAVSVGNIFSVWFDEKDGYYWCNGIINDKEAIDLINKGYSVSCQYTITEYSDNETNALHNGNPYDKIIENGKPEHLAIVNNPRYEGAKIAVNAIIAQNAEKWITIHPHGEESDDYRRLKLEDGESPKEAIERVYKKEDKKEDKKLTNKEVHEKLNDLREKMRKYNLAGDRTNDEYKRLNAEYQKTLDEWDISQPNEDIKEDKQEDFEKGTKSTKKDEDRHQKIRDLEDKAYKEFKKTYDNYINGDVKISDFGKAKEQFNKKYKDAFDKLESDRFVSFEDFAKRENNQSDTKEEKQDTSDSPFGEGVEIIESDKKGYMLDSKNLKSYRKGDKFTIVDDWSNEDGDRFTVRFYDGKKHLTSKTYTTKRGMEKAIREHLQGGANKETKALETKTDLNAAKEKYNDILKKYNDAEHKKWQRGISNEEYNQAWEDSAKYKKELTTARREYAESIMSNFEEVDENPYEEKQQARRERYEELSEKAATESSRAHQAFRDKMSVIPFGQPIHGAKDARYREKAWDTLGRGVKLGEKADYYADKAKSVGKAGISADDANAIAKLARKYKSGVDSAEKRRIIDRVIEIHKNTERAKEATQSDDYKDLGFAVERNADINRLQLKFDGKPSESVRSILKHNGFRWSPREGAWQRQLTGNAEYSLKRVADELKANNSFVEEFKDTLYDVIAGGIWECLGE